jgi:sodium-dependent phosphate cotransporter
LQAGSLIIGTLLLMSGRTGAVPASADGAALSSQSPTCIFDPISGLFQEFFTRRGGCFVVGLGIILITFNLFDKCLPEMTIKESQVGRVSRLVYQPMIMFLLGSAVTLVSMSVSVSLSILVPPEPSGLRAA